MRKIKKITAIEHNLMAFNRRLAIITLSDGEKRLYYQSRYGTRVTALQGSWSRLPGITLDYAMGQIGWLIKPYTSYYQQNTLQRTQRLTHHHIGRMDLSFFSSDPEERDQDIFIVSVLNQHPLLNKHLSSKTSRRTRLWSNNLMKLITLNTESINVSEIPILHQESVSAPIQSAPLQFHHCHTVSDIIRLMQYCVTQNIKLDPCIPPMATQEHLLLWKQHERIINLAHRACSTTCNPHSRLFSFMHTKRNTFFHHATEFLKTTASHEHANTPPLSVLTFINDSATTSRLLPLATIMEEKKRTFMQSAQQYSNTTKMGVYFRPHHPLHAIACEFTRLSLENPSQENNSTLPTKESSQATTFAHPHQANSSSEETKDSLTHRM